MIGKEKEELLSNPSTGELEKQISEERARLSTDRMDISFGELINLYKNDELVIRPEYQRLFRWTNSQKTALIESILLGIPVPPIFVAEDENGIWELVDGLQRVSTIISFYGELKSDLSDTEENDSNDEDEEQVINQNKWILESGSLIKELEGFNVDSLPKKYTINIKRAVCRVEILRGESNTAMKYELFKRLNSGGSKLTAQEIRNAVYRGINPRINILIEDLSKIDDFGFLVSISEQKKQELYDQELVLRFIAFINNADSINSNTESFLDNFMEKAVKDDTFDINYYKGLFIRVMAALRRINDQNVFRNDHNAFVPAYYEGITIGTAQNIETYEQNIELLKEKIDEIKKDQDFKKYSGSASNSKNRVRNRLKRANEIFEVG